MENQENQGRIEIPLDGSYGTGTVSELTIFTKQGDGVREETFVVPYFLLDMGKLVAFNNLHLILGFKILKQDKPSPLKELGL